MEKRKNKIKDNIHDFSTKIPLIIIFCSFNHHLTFLSSTLLEMRRNQ